MTKPRSDALVFFGASGDLAYKKIFPALQAIARRGKLDFLVIGVAKSAWTRDQLIDRARASVTEYGGEDKEAFAKLAANLALCAAWIPGSGALGAARACLVSYAAQSMLFAAMFRKSRGAEGPPVPAP